MGLTPASWVILHPSVSWVVVLVGDLTPASWVVVHLAVQCWGVVLVRALTSFSSADDGLSVAILVEWSKALQLVMQMVAGPVHLVMIQVLKVLVRMEALLASVAYCPKAFHTKYHRVAAQRIASCAKSDVKAVWILCIKGLENKKYESFGDALHGMKNTQTHCSRGRRRDFQYVGSPPTEQISGATNFFMHTYLI